MGDEVKAWTDIELHNKRWTLDNVPDKFRNAEEAGNARWFATLAARDAELAKMREALAAAVEDERAACEALCRQEARDQGGGGASDCADAIAARKVIASPPAPKPDAKD